MQVAEIWKWDAATVAAAIRSRTISSREAVKASIERLHAVNPVVNAVVDILEEEALSAADVADAQFARGYISGPLHGVPVTTKINVDMAGRPTTNGLAAFKAVLAGEDSAPVASLRQAGAVIVGRTNVPAFSYRWFTENELHGRTFNPWGRDLSPGGSSGGAAAAVAVGIGALAHGNDVAGSLRLPASACGIYGFKPTVGRVPSYNPSQMVERSLCLQMGATEGVMARSVEDIRIGLHVLERPDHRDPLMVQGRVMTGDVPMSKRVAVYRATADDQVHSDIVELLHRAAGWFEDAGYIVEYVDMPRMAEMAELWMSMLYAEMSDSVREAFFNLGGGAFKTSYLNTAAVLPVLTPEEFHKAWQRRLAIKRAWALLFQSYPVALMPTCFQPTFPMNHDLGGVEQMRNIVRAYRPLAAIAGLGAPAISVPVGFADGSPSGVQLVSSWFQDEHCLLAASVLEQRIGALSPIDPRNP